MIRFRLEDCKIITRNYLVQIMLLIVDVFSVVHSERIKGMVANLTRDRNQIYRVAQYGLQKKYRTGVLRQMARNGHSNCHAKQYRAIPSYLLNRISLGGAFTR